MNAETPNPFWMQICVGLSMLLISASVGLALIGFAYMPLLLKLMR